MPANEPHAERLQDFLSARHERLSGHEMALPLTADELRGAELLADVLVAHGIRPRELCAVLGSVHTVQGVRAIVEQALHDRRLDELVQQVDQAFELEFEPQAQMAP